MGNFSHYSKSLSPFFLLPDRIPFLDVGLNLLVRKRREVDFIEEMFSRLSGLTRSELKHTCLSRDLFIHREKLSAALRFSPDGSELLVVSGGLENDDMLRSTALELWDVGTGDREWLVDQEVEAHMLQDSGVTSHFEHELFGSISFSPDGKTFACSGGDYEMKMRLRKSRSGATIETIAEGYYQWMKMSPDHNFILAMRRVVYPEEPALHILNGRTGNFLRSIDEVTYAVVRLAFSPDNTVLATTGFGGVPIHLWYISTGTLLRSFVMDCHDIPGLDFSPDGNTIVCVKETRRDLYVGRHESSYELCFWDIRSGSLRESRMLRATDKAGDSIHSPAYSLDGQKMKMVDARTNSVIIQFLE